MKNARGDHAATPCDEIEVCIDALSVPARWGSEHQVRAAIESALRRRLREARASVGRARCDGDEPRRDLRRFTGSEVEALGASLAEAIETALGSEHTRG
jgi:hypothetical protein